MAKQEGSSPRWSPTAKLIAGLTLVAVIAAIVVRFSSFIGPLLMAVILTYLLHPLARKLSESTRLSWRASVGVVFVGFIALLIWLLTRAGVALVDQFGNLFTVVEDYFTGLPTLLQDLTTQTFQIGPFQLGLSGLEQLLVNNFNITLADLSQELLAAVQPALGQAGTVVGSVATSAVTTIGWILFIFVITFLLLSDSGNASFFSGADMPTLDSDMRRLVKELNRIWNSFLRSQLVLVTLIMVTSFIMLSLLGVRYALALALITGLAKFIPYVGSAALYIITAVVTLFQAQNYLGIEPGTTYMLVATIATIVMDQIFDNLVTPRFMGQVLGVHPAAVLITALVAANLLGFVGLLLAAPVLATLLLITTFVIRKMVDADPWPSVEAMKTEDRETFMARHLQPVFNWTKNTAQRFWNAARQRIGQMRNQK